MKSTILYSTRDRGHLLDMSLWSVLHGSRLPEEIIVTDDGPGRDHTAEVVRRYADEFRDIQISYIIHRRLGGWANPAIPRNKGIRLSNPNHEILMFSEPEMLWHPDTLRTLMDWFENPPAKLPVDSREAWREPGPLPERFFLTASYIGYCNLEQTPLDLYQNFDAIFGHQTVDRRWPEINTRVAAARREDVFAVRGWNEQMHGWGYDDTDFMTRMSTLGVSHVPLPIPVIHLPHLPPPAGGPEAERNLQMMQADHNRGNYAANGPRWGLGPEEPLFATKITPEVWMKIQADELESWTTKAWPSKSGKLYRERKYLQQAFTDLGLDGEVKVGRTGTPETPLLFLDVGCGPLSVLEGWEHKSHIQVLAIDPLHAGYESTDLRVMAGAKHKYVYGRGEKLDFPDASVDLITSVNGIDHFEDPEATLAEMNRVLHPGGTIRLHFCVNNASEGHPHPAHRIDLDIADVVDWALKLGLEVEQTGYVFYGWRHQLAAALVFSKPTN